jgi:ferredoxin--NADP+ reductase
MKVAIVGSGPAAYYVAEGLVARLGGEVEVDLVERLPTPYGLVRSGVAPDHQTTKQVWRRFAALHADDAVCFHGDVEVGTDVTVDELRALYDAVVLATGAGIDRRLGIPGEDLPGVYGAARFVGWYNGHPDDVDPAPVIKGDCAVIIGNGNVALDVARVLSRAPAELAASDISAEAAAVIGGSGLRSCRIVGRRGPMQVGFSLKELGELGSLSGVSTTADPAQMPAAAETAAAPPPLAKVLRVIEGFARGRPIPGSKRLHLEFFARPVAILGEGHVTGVRFERTVPTATGWIGTGEHFERACGLVVTCIGYRSRPVPGVPYDERRGVLANDGGVIAPGLYCAGWSGHAPTGTIGSNRPEGLALAARIAQGPRGARAGRAGLRPLLARRGRRAVSFDEWRRIDAAEVAAAAPGAPRAKFLRRPDLLRAAAVTC